MCHLITTSTSLVAMALTPPPPLHNCGSQIPGAMATVIGVINLVICTTGLNPSLRVIACIFKFVEWVNCDWTAPWFSSSASERVCVCVNSGYFTQFRWGKKWVHNLYKSHGHLIQIYVFDQNDYVSEKMEMNRLQERSLIYPSQSNDWEG